MGRTEKRHCQPSEIKGSDIKSNGMGEHNLVSEILIRVILENRSRDRNCDCVSMDDGGKQTSSIKSLVDLQKAWRDFLIHFNVL